MQTDTDQRIQKKERLHARQFDNSIDSIRIVYSLNDYNRINNY